LNYETLESGVSTNIPELATVVKEKLLSLVYFLCCVENNNVKASWCCVRYMDQIGLAAVIDVSANGE